MMRPDIFDRSRPVCSRCGRGPRRARELNRWNVNIRAGYVVEVICPRCQTVEENVEAEIRIATTDYSHTWVDSLGRWWGPTRPLPGGQS